MTTSLMTTLVVMTTARPKIDPGFDIPGLNNLCFDMQHAYTWWNSTLTTYDHQCNDHLSGHDHSQT